MMDNFVDERDDKLLESDRYTFCVLSRIMKGDTEILLSDHERLIMCFTGQPFPVWIWIPQDATEDDMERAYLLAEEKGLLDGNHSFNIKYELAEYFQKRAASAPNALSLKVETNLFAYDCLTPIAPTEKADGGLHQCTPEDLEDLTKILVEFHKETGIDERDIENYRLDAALFISTGRMFFWKDENGNTVASCKYAPSGDLASLNCVFTWPEYRPKHYAENLVYNVTLIAKEEGFTPMLYTDADYVASNACYEKIGYVLRGKLCTLG